MSKLIDAVEKDLTNFDVVALETILKQDISLKELNEALFRAKSYEAIDLLIKYGADIENISPSCGTPLLFALLKKDDFLAIYLVEKHGADVNAYMPKSADRFRGWSPLIFCSHCENFLPVVQVLVNNGAIIDYALWGDQTAIKFAIERDNLEVADFLQESLASPQYLKNVEQSKEKRKQITEQRRKQIAKEKAEREAHAAKEKAERGVLEQERRTQEKCIKCETTLSGMKECPFCAEEVVGTEEHCPHCSSRIREHVPIPKSKNTTDPLKSVKNETFVQCKFCAEEISGTEFDCPYCGSQLKSPEPRIMRTSPKSSDAVIAPQPPPKKSLNRVFLGIGSAVVLLGLGLGVYFLLGRSPANQTSTEEPLNEPVETAKPIPEVTPPSASPSVPGAATANASGAEAPPEQPSVSSSGLVSTSHPVNEYESWWRSVPEKSGQRLQPDETSTSSEMSFHPSSHAFDGTHKTSWNETAPGQGAGEWIEATYSSPQRIHYIRLATGYSAMSEKWGDLFVKNAHIKKLSVTFDDGETRIVNVDGQEREVELLDLNVTASRVRFTALEVYPGQKWSDLCISEIELWGEPGSGE